ncbi:hypothetical protein FRB90_005420 [Tulasnella sp. 427]|nr:hypothetical protein FRB90_005420 [Tulasnella sp. 427]
MRLSTLFAASLASFAAAVAITDLPSCALTCLTTADYGNCSQSDIDMKCLCQSQPFITSSTACIRSSCSAADDAKASQISNELCAAAGVTLSISATATATGSASAASSAATSAATSAAASASGAASSVSASASAHVSSVSSAVASVISSASVAAASATTTSKNAAPTNVVGHGAVVAGIVAVAALAL